ncbi:MAG: hypothetical protein WAU11_12380 [Ignavibacteriaceae bacterium]
MQSKLFLSNNSFWMIQLIFALAFTFMGIFNPQSVNIYFILLGLGFLFLFFIGNPKYSFIAITNNSVSYKKSFFHKIILIKNISITTFEYSSNLLIINTNNNQYKISTADIRDYDYKNTLPNIINELKIIVENNKMPVH